MLSMHRPIRSVSKGGLWMSSLVFIVLVLTLLTLVPIDVVMVQPVNL